MGGSRKLIVRNRYQVDDGKLFNFVALWTGHEV